MQNHENHDTRYDILLSAWDYMGEDKEPPGPVFKFKDVGLMDLGIHDTMFLPPFVSTGSNIHIIARVYDINENDGIIRLDPESISER